MKKLLFLFVLTTLFFTSCSKTPDDSKTEFIISKEKAFKTDSVGLNQFGNIHGERHEYYPEYAVIQPTWGQSFHYAWKAGYAIWVIVSLVLLAGAIYVFYKASKDEDLTSTSPHGSRIPPSPWIAFILLVGALAAFGGQPGKIRWNNYKQIDKEAYDRTVLIYNSSQPIWDSLEVHHLIIGGK